MTRTRTNALRALAATISLMVGPATAAETVMDKPFEVESGVIEIRKSVKNPAITSETVETFYFKDFGKVQARYSTETVSNKYVKTPQVKRSMTLTELADKTGDSMNTKDGKVGQEPVAGMTCDVYEAVTEMGSMKQTTRTYLWKNILLKTVSSGMGTDIHEEATSVKTDSMIPADKFTVPKGVKIKEIKLP